MGKPQFAHNKTEEELLMTTDEYIQFILDEKRENPLPHPIDEPSAYEAAQLVSGGFTYLLYESSWVNGYDTDAITQHLESLYDSENHFGLIYFLFILANAVDFIVPAQFSAISANGALVPILSAAIIEDWLEYDVTSEATEYKNQ